TLSPLPPEYAKALVQKYVEGRSVAEMAAIRGKGEKAVESVLTRARTAFARVFELLAKSRGGLEGCPAQRSRRSSSGTSSSSSRARTSPSSPRRSSAHGSAAPWRIGLPRPPPPPP